MITLYPFTSSESTGRHRSQMRRIHFATECQHLLYYNARECHNQHNLLHMGTVCALLKVPSSVAMSRKA